jgi:branched-chain amino acid transport system ATP-binding protein
VLETVLLAAKWRAPASDLAHGEKRKLELAILLALEPEVLLLDEPTAGMALEEVPVIIDLVQRIRARGDTTILLVEHKIDMVLALSDTIAVLKDGRLIAEGSPAAVRADPAVQAAYFGGGAGA